MDWLDYLTSALSPLELNDTEPVVVYAKEYLQQVSELINKTDRKYVCASEIDEAKAVKSGTGSFFYRLKKYSSICQPYLYMATPNDYFNIQLISHSDCLFLVILSM